MVGLYYMPVVHETYGTGKITAWDGRTITVRYANEEKRHWFPLTFTAGKLKATNDKDVKAIQEIIDRWTEALIERETASLVMKHSPEDVSEVAAHIRSLLKDAYAQAELEERIEKSLVARYEEWSAKHKSLRAGLNFTKESKFTGGMFANFGIQLLTVLASACSFGIAYPFMLCWKMRWEAEHTVIDGQKLTFDGKGSQLFGKYMLWMLFSYLTFGAYATLVLPLNVSCWATEHTHFEGTTGTRSTFDASVWQYFGARLLARLVTGVSFGFGAFWAHCYLERWQAKHTSYDGYGLQFDGTAMQYFGKCIVWTLLTVVTLGIYGFWREIKVKQWTISHTHVA